MPVVQNTPVGCALAAQRARESLPTAIRCAASAQPT